MGLFLVPPSPPEIRKSCHEILAKEQSGHAILSAPAVVFDLSAVLTGNQTPLGGVYTLPKRLAA